MVIQNRINPDDIPNGGFKILPLTPSQLLEIGWKAGINAVNEFNIPVSTTNDYAVAWSIHGAMTAVYHRQTFNPDTDEKLWIEIKHLLDNGDMLDWELTGGRTQQEVVELMQQAEQNIGMEQIIPTPEIRRY